MRFIRIIVTFFMAMSVLTWIDFSVYAEKSPFDNSGIAYFPPKSRISHYRIGLQFSLPFTSRVAISRRGNYYELEAYPSDSGLRTGFEEVYLYTTDFPAPKKEADPPPYLFSPCNPSGWNGKKEIVVSCKSDTSESQMTIMLIAGNKKWHLLILYLSEMAIHNRDDILKSVKINPEFISPEEIPAGRNRSPG